MATDYRSYLAANILSEERVITYRLLSRALKIHVNTAKQMLFEFHRQQNVKKPGTIHATYLVAGIKRKLVPSTTNGNAVKDGEDETMQSSPFRSSPILNSEEAAEESPVLSITLAREENLEELQSQYEMITSIHVYSLAPHRLKDLQILSDAARETAEVEANQDPLEAAGMYGTIINKAARRRTGRRLPPSMQSTTATTHAKASSLPSKQADVNDAKSESTPPVKPEAEASPSAKDIPIKGFQGKRNVSANPPQLKRDSSSIFKSFAKTKPPLKREATNSSAGASELDSAPQSGPEDEVMKETSDGEEDDYIPPPQESSKGAGDADRKSRKEREAALKKMMEDDDDDEEDGESDVIIENQQPENSRQSPARLPTEDVIRGSGGRRRGRRRVMKKKTIKDDEGYLVTREEPAWESFSDDEPVQTKAKPSSSLPPSSDKPKKGLGKAGQGSIMSFFGKK